MAENRFKKFATPPSGQGVIITDPYAASEERRKQSGDARAEEQLRISRDNQRRLEEQAARDAENDRLANEERQLKIDEKAKEAERLALAQASGLQDALYSIKSVIDAARKAKTKSGDFFATGFGSSTAAGWGGSSAADVEALLNTVASNTAFDRLQKMREQSPTGGALGAVSERELALLRDTVASLSQSQSDSQFQANMQTVIDAYTRVQAKLTDADAYYRQNGSMEGYRPPTEETIEKLVNGGSDVAPPTAGPGAAGSGATESSVPVPAEMQVEWADHISQNWGRLDPAELNRFRQSLHLKYDYPFEVPDHTGFAEKANAAAAKGAPPSIVSNIPAGTKELSGGEQLMNNVVSNPFGTSVASYANAATFGLPDLLDGEGRLQAAKDVNPVSGFLGDMAGGITGTLATGGAIGLGARAAGAAGRAAQVAAKPFAADMLYGTVYGGSTAAANDENVILGALMGSGGALVGDRLGALAGRGIARAVAPEDVLNSGERAVVDAMKAAGSRDAVADALARAEALGVPMTPADSSPELRSLTGSAVRFSPEVAGQARDTFYRRNAGQLDRLSGAIERDLGPVTNIPQRSADLAAEASRKAGPLYDAAYAAPDSHKVMIDDLMRRPSFQPSLREAYRLALEEGKDPRVLGFVMDEAGEVNIDPARFGGRYSRVAAGSERDVLKPRSYRTWNGGTVNKRGPVDLVGWIRLRGGLKDQGGELSHMGLDNKARKGMDLVGEEAKFGPLVDNENGGNFDDMAMQAWEAGFFPELTERPTIVEFLDALQNTHTGTGARRWRPEDVEEVNAFEEMRKHRYDVEQGRHESSTGTVWSDKSVDAGPDRPFAPAEAYGDLEGQLGLSWEALDNVKRGMDSIIERETDSVTGKVSNYGRTVIATKNELLKRMDDLNWNYGSARRAYAGPTQEREFLARGQDALKVDPNNLGVDIAGLTDEQLGQMRLGFQSGMMDQAGRLRNNSNPFGQINTPRFEGQARTLYGSASDADVGRLLDQRNLELQLAGSANQITGNSLTAEREIADEFFRQQPGLGGDIVQGALETAVLGGPWITVGKRIGDRLWADRRAAAASAANRQMADEIGPVLLREEGAMPEIDRLLAEGDVYQQMLDARRKAAQRWGQRVGTGVGVATTDALAY